MTKKFGYMTLMVCALGIALMTGACGKKTLEDPGMDTDPTPTETTDRGGNTGDNDGDRNGISDGDEFPDRPMTLSDVFFDLDAYSLRSDSRRLIEANADAILANPEWRIVTLEGHCDERGTVEYNLALGQKRADSVKGYLMQLGVPGNKLQTISYGEERPFDTGYGEAAWAQNRRVHFAR